MPRKFNSIGAKLMAAFLAMGAIIALQGVYGYHVLNQAGDMVVDTFDRPLMAVNYARAAEFDFSQIERKLLSRAAAPEAQRASIDKDIDALQSTFQDDLGVAKERSLFADELKQIAIIKSLMAQWTGARRLHDTAKAAEIARKMDDTFDLLIEFNTDHSFVGRRMAVEAVARFRYLLAAGLVASLLLAFAITAILERRIAWPLAQAASAARHISTGKFETPIPHGSSDETGALLRSMTVMQESIRTMVLREKARAASAEGRLTDALETSDEGVILVGPDGRIAVVNSRLRAFFPAVAADLAPGANYAQALSRMQSQFADVAPGRPEDSEAGEHRLPDGRWVRLTVSPTTEGGSIVFLSDFTEIKEREESLRIAKQQAEAASAAKSRFLANMGHELRTPLNAIIGFSEIIGRQVFGAIANARYVEYAGDIERSGRHLLGVINNVLDLSRTASGTLTLDVEEIDLRAVLRDCEDRVADLIASAGIEFSTSGLESALPVKGDTAKLGQIFDNLLSNAVKFTAPGGRVVLAAEASAESVLVQVSDSGIGMSGEEIDVALTAFGQVDARLERKYEGAGLGLPLARDLVRLHGGELSIDSRQGHGTTVSVKLPRASASTETLRQAHAG